MTGSSGRFGQTLGALAQALKSIGKVSADARAIDLVLTSNFIGGLLKFDFTIMGLALGHDHLLLPHRIHV